jgi:hypothetical protein
MVVDYDGRILAQADPGPGEKIVVAEIDLGALRTAREQRLGHNPQAHLRREAYHGAIQGYPAASFVGAKDPQGNRTAPENELTIRKLLESNLRPPAT